MQLYKYQNDSALVRSQAYYRGLPAFVPAPATPEVPRVFLQYLRQNRVPYASSITMVIGPISKPRSAIVLRRPAVPWEQEKHRMKFQQMATNMAGAGEGGVGGAMDKDKAEVVRRGVMLRSRKPTESCLLPNKLLHRLGAGKEGALVCKFNNSGTLIAVACCNGDEFPVRIYDSEGGGLRHEFLGHHSIVYDLQWSLNDHYLVSACGDGTSKVFCLGSLGQKSKKGEESEEEGVGEGEEEEESGASEAEESGEDENDDTSNSTGSSGGVKKKKRKVSGARAKRGRSAQRRCPLANIALHALHYNPPFNTCVARAGKEAGAEQHSGQAVLGRDAAAHAAGLPVRGVLPAARGRQEAR